MIKIPARYLTPKWQAYVLPVDRAFGFANGVKVSSLWQLKQAFLSLPEDLINPHIREQGNDFADWVEHVIEDLELAAELRKYNHRWGLLVALERHLMRTVALPANVAKRWLRPAVAPFTFVSGEQVSSLEQLALSLEHLSDETISFHRERKPNDIAAWIADCIGDYELAELVDEAASRAQMERFVKDHLEMLKEAALDQ